MMDVLRQSLQRLWFVSTLLATLGFEGAQLQLRRYDKFSVESQVQLAKGCPRLKSALVIT